MALEASEVAVRVRLLGGSAFQTEAQRTSASIEEMGAAGNRANADLAKSSTAVTGLGSKLESAGTKVDNFGRSMMNVGRAMLPLSLGVAAVGYYASRAATQFQKSMLLLYTQAGLPRKNLQGLTNDFLKLSVAIGQVPSALSQGAFHLVSSGFHNNAQITSIMRVAGQMAGVGQDSVDATTNALAYIMSTNLGRGLTPQRIAGMIESAIGQGNMHMSDVTQAMSTGILSMAKNAHIPFSQIISAMAAESRTGILPSSAMSRLRLTLTSMMAPTAAGTKAMAQLGLSPFALSNDMRKGGLLAALSDLAMHAQTVSPTLANNYVAEIFGKSRGISSVVTLLNLLNELYGINTNVNKATYGGNFLPHWEAYTHSFAYKEGVLKARFDVGMIQLGNTINRYILPTLLQLGTFLLGIVNDFSKLPNPLKKFIVYFGAIVALLAPGLILFGSMFRAIGTFAHITGIAISWIQRLGVASEIAAGEEGGGGLLAFGRGLASLVGRMTLLAGAAYGTYKVFQEINKQHDKAKKVWHAKHPGAVFAGQALHDYFHNTQSPSHFSLLNPGSWFSGPVGNYIPGSGDFLSAAALVGRYAQDTAEAMTGGGGSVFGAGKGGASLTSALSNTSVQNALKTQDNDIKRLPELFAQQIEAALQAKPLHVHVSLDGKKVQEHVHKHDRKMHNRK